MFNLGKNKYFVAGFAILMAVGLMAAYIPMLFPQVPAGNTGVVSGDILGNVSGDISGTAQLNQNALSGTDVQTATSTPTSTDKSASLPSSLSGLQDEQNSLNDINNLLNQSQ